MGQYTTEQEAFWASSFGDEYTERNRGHRLYAANLALFSRILARTQRVRSAIELGANIGLNLQAIKQLLPGVDLAAVEINEKAATVLERQIPGRVYNQSILNFEPDRDYDFVLSKGVLIHIDPERLTDVYDWMYSASSRYLCVVEYYNPSPVQVLYRGHKDRLFKRDFAGELLDRYEDLCLRDYGFVYHRDPVFPGDDLTWFLLEKER